MADVDGSVYETDPVYSGAFGTVVPGTVYSLGCPVYVAPDTTAPVISNWSPALGTVIGEMQPISFDVADDSGELRRVIVHAVFADGVAEVVHDGSEWRGYYRTDSNQRVLITKGYRYTVLRHGGWPSSPTFNVFAIDSSGNEAA